MHVAYVLFGVPPGFRGGGIPLCVRTWVTLLGQAGHRVSVVSTFKDPHEIPLHPLCDYYHIEPGRALPGRFALANDLLHSRRLANGLKASGLLADVDAVDVQECQIAPFVFPTCDQYNIRKIHSVHLSALGGGQRFNWLPRKVHRYFNLKAARMADGVITVSNWVKDLYVANGIANDRIHVVYNSVESGSTVKKGHHHGQGITCLWLGRFYSGKGVEVAIAAAMKVLDQLPLSRFVFVGEGPYLEQARQQLGEQLGDRVRFEGHINDPGRLAQIRSEADVYFFTTVHETFGRTLAEGMAAGLACIASDLPVLREVMADTGFYFKPNDADDLASKLLALAADDAMRHQLGSSAQRRVKELFSNENISKQLLGAYQSILS